MDVAKYIGLFLLKNEQCYVHGLGTLQLLRKPATYDGQALLASAHEIIMVPGGNVDESLANFIATNEQISITKATGALKEFSAETKNQIQAGNPVRLPHLGKFTADDGRIGFITDPQLQFKAAPIIAPKGVSLQHNERPPIPHQPYIPTTPIGSPLAGSQQAPTPAMPHVRQYMQDAEPKERLNWARIIFVILLLLVMAGGAYYGYERYLAPKKRSQQPVLTMPDKMEEEAPVEELPVDTAMSVDSTMLTDSIGNEPTEVPPPIPGQTPAQVKAQEKTPVTTPVTTQPPQKMRSMRILVNSYDTKEEAYRRKRTLEAKGNKVDVLEADTNLFDVIMNIKTSSRDDYRVEDSMSKLYNPDGVFIVQ